MSASEKVGPLRVRPHIVKGVETGKVFVDIPERYSDTGGRYRPLFDNRKEAVNFARDLEKRIRKKATTVAPPAPASAQTFRKTAEDWAALQRLKHDAGQKGAGALETELNRAKPLKAHFGNRKLDRLQERDVLQYKRDRKTAGIGRVTINAELAVLRRILNHAGSRHLTVAPVPGQKKRHKPPTPAEVARIVSHLRGRFQLVVRLMAEAGLRPDEAYHATWAWFGRYRSGKPYVHVQWIEVPGDQDDWFPKTQSSDRCVPISEDLFQRITSLERTSMWVFPSPRSPEQPIASIRKSLLAAAREADVTRDGRPLFVTPKLFRKFFGSMLAAAKVDRSVIQDLVGHERGSPVTEMFYIFLEHAAEQEAVQHVQLDLTRANLAIAGNGPDSKAALRAFLQAQLPESAG